MANSISSIFGRNSKSTTQVKNKMRMIWILSLFAIWFFGSMSVFPYLYAGLSLIPFVVLTLYILMEGRGFFNLKRPLGIAYFILLIITCNLLIKGIGVLFYVQGVIINFIINLVFALIYFGLLWLLVFRRR